MRIAHTMIRVKDLERSKSFYTKLLGMRVLREKEYPAYGFTLAFVGYGSESDSAVIELHYKWDKEDDYIIGDGFGHIAIWVDNIEYSFCSIEQSQGQGHSRSYAYERGQQHCGGICHQRKLCRYGSGSWSYSFAMSFGCKHSKLYTTESQSQWHRLSRKQCRMGLLD